MLHHSGIVRIKWRLSGVPLSLPRLSEDASTKQGHEEANRKRVATARWNSLMWRGAWKKNRWDRDTRFSWKSVYSYSADWAKSIGNTTRSNAAKTILFHSRKRWTSMILFVSFARILSVLYIKYILSRSNTGKYERTLCLPWTLWLNDLLRDVVDR